MSSNSICGQEFNLDDLKLPDGLNQIAIGNVAKPGLKVKSQVLLSQGSQIGLLSVDVTMNKSWKIYSMTQPAGGPKPTSIHLAPSDDYRLLGSFSPTEPPHVEYSEEFRSNVESFQKHVRWVVPIEISGPTATVKIQGHLEGLACAGQCVALKKDETQFSAGVTTSNAKFLHGQQIAGTHATVNAWLSKSAVLPGETVQLFVSLVAEPNWHVYAYEGLPPSDFQKPTLIQVTLPKKWEQGSVKSAAPVVSEKSPIPGDPPIRKYAGPATIAVPIKIPDNARAGKHPLSGHIALQTCATQCDRPIAIAWHGGIVVTNSPDSSEPAPLQIGQTTNYNDVVKLLQKSARTDRPDVKAK